MSDTKALIDKIRQYRGCGHPVMASALALLESHETLQRENAALRAEVDSLRDAIVEAVVASDCMAYHEGDTEDVVNDSIARSERADAALRDIMLEGDCQ